MKNKRTKKTNANKERKKGNRITRETDNTGREKTKKNL